MSKVGIAVECKTCRHQKAPHGRSASQLRQYCDNTCPGYDDDPKPGCLWPGETSEEFGYAFCSNATKDVADA